MRPSCHLPADPVPIPFRIRLLGRGDSRVEEICEGSIPDDEWARALTFRDCAKQLDKAEWVKIGLDAEYTVAFERGAEAVVEMSNPPRDAAVRELLMLLRPFILEREPTSFLRVLGTFRRHIRHPALQRLFKRERRIFLKGEFGSFGDISISSARADPFSGEMPIHDDTKTLNSWLNAFVRDCDPKEGGGLLPHSDDVDDELLHAALRALIADKARSVMWLAGFIDELAAPSSSCPR